MSDSPTPTISNLDYRSMQEPTTSPSTEEASQATPLEAMDPQVTSIQPGGGVVVHLELAWGRVRRWWLKTFRRGYVERMRGLRKGDCNPCPHEVLDPRDLKFYQNQGGYYWECQDDPFTGRDRIPFARPGLAELLVFSTLTLGPAIGLTAWALVAKLAGLTAVIVWLLVATFAVIGGLVVWFFRDPNRRIPAEAGLVVSPADGKVVEIEEIEDEFIGGPAIKIGIFLSIFNVHMNRTPTAARVVGIKYRRGKFLNAMRPESARENEQLAVRMQQTEAPYRRMIVRQITGAVARRIVCWVKPGDELSRGERFGMIKLGSRTELVLPRDENLSIEVSVGQTVKAGTTVFARYSGTN